ncbi:MAG: hypothetical protein C0489_11710, partial [Candidatus Accumulibacter sp.]|nr:hypothetical protein [Accumulibacter sp.]
MLLPIGPTAAVSAPPVDAGMFEELRRQDLRIATISARLAIANAGSCTTLDPVPGLVLHDAAQYAPEVRGDADRHFGLNGGTGVEAVVPDSPAARAGLRQDDRIVAINGMVLPQAPPKGSAAASTAAVEQTLRRLLDALRRGPATIEVERDGQRTALALSPVAGCRSRVELMTSD